MYPYHDYEPDFQCFECQEKTDVFIQISHWLSAVIDQLYDLEEFDAEMLEYYLSQLAIYTKVKLPQSKLSVVPKESVLLETPNVLERWKSLNKHYLKSLVQTGV